MPKNLTAEEQLMWQVNTRVTRAEREYLEQWAAKKVWSLGVLARLILRAAIRTDAEARGQLDRLPEELQEALEFSSIVAQEATPQRAVGGKRR